MIDHSNVHQIGAFEHLICSKCLYVQQQSHAQHVKITYHSLYSLILMCNSWCMQEPVEKLQVWVWIYM